MPRQIPPRGALVPERQGLKGQRTGKTSNGTSAAMRDGARLQKVTAFDFDCRKKSEGKTT